MKNSQPNTPKIHTPTPYGSEIQENGRVLWRTLDPQLPLQSVLPEAPAMDTSRDGWWIPESHEQLRAFHPEVVLYCPQIPQNAGSIARMCAGMGMRLHLIEPMGFDITEKGLRRAGLDYWDSVEVYLHSSWEGFVKTRVGRRFLFVETGGKDHPGFFQYQPGDLLVFGAETFGIPKDVWGPFVESGQGHVLTWPLFHPQVRSFNLSNTVSIVSALAIAQLHGPTPRKEITR